MSIDDDVKLLRGCWVMTPENSEVSGQPALARILVRLEELENLNRELTEQLKPHTIKDGKLLQIIAELRVELGARHTTQKTLEEKIKTLTEENIKLSWDVLHAETPYRNERLKLQLEKQGLVEALRICGAVECDIKPELLRPTQQIAREALEKVKGK